MLSAARAASGTAAFSTSGATGVTPFSLFLLALAAVCGVFISSILRVRVEKAQ